MTLSSRTISPGGPSASACRDRARRRDRPAAMTISMTCSTMTMVMPRARMARTRSTPPRLGRRQGRSSLRRAATVSARRKRARHFQPTLFRRRQIAGHGALARPQADEIEHVARVVLRASAAEAVRTNEPTMTFLDDAHRLETFTTWNVGRYRGTHAAWRRVRLRPVLSKTMRPSVGFRTPAIALNRVDLPAVRTDQPGEFRLPHIERTSALATRPPESLRDRAHFEKGVAHAAFLRLRCMNAPTIPSGPSSAMPMTSRP